MTDDTKRTWHLAARDAREAALEAIEYGDDRDADDMAHELRDHARRQSAAHSYPREIAFLDSLPMTVTGKVLRRELRALSETECPQSESSV